MSDALPKQLDFDFALGSKFLESFDEGPPPTLRQKLNSANALETGTLYSLLLKFADRETEFQLHASLLEHKDDHAVFEFLVAERQRLELVLVSARGESLPYRRRRHTRIPCQFGAQITLPDGSTRDAKTANLGAGGVQLLLAVPLEIDELIEIRLNLRGGTVLGLVGRVTNRIDAGPERGNSVEFLFASAKQRDEVAAAAEALEAEQDA